ncbi:MAG: gamma-glutamylcyclotransferase family protein [Longimicrobiales bacterium]
MSILYFAYGSNLCGPRLRDRAPGTETLWPASLPDFELRWHKRGSDGSGKCSIVRAPCSGRTVHGVLYRLPPDSKAKLDEIEGLGVGYDEVRVGVHGNGGVREAFTYLATSNHIDESLRPYAWYKHLVVTGATSHGLPPGYVAELRAVDAWIDPDVQRVAGHLACLRSDRSS